MDGRGDAGGAGLQRLGAADLAAVGGDGGVVGHVLRLERADAEAAVGEGAGEAGDDQGLADVGAGALEHQAEGGGFAGWSRVNGGLLDAHRMHNACTTHAPGVCGRRGEVNGGGAARDGRLRSAVSGMTGRRGAAERRRWSPGLARQPAGAEPFTFHGLQSLQPARALRAFPRLKCMVASVCFGAKHTGPAGKARHLRPWRLVFRTGPRRVTHSAPRDVSCRHLTILQRANRCRVALLPLRAVPAK